MEIKVLPQSYINARLVIRIIVGVSAFSFSNIIKIGDIIDSIYVSVAFILAVTTNVTPTEMYKFPNRELLQNTS